MSGVTNWAVTVAADRVTIDEHRRATTTIAAVNLSVATRPATLAIVADGNVAAWFSVADPVRLVEPGARMTWAVSAAVPPGAAPGEYPFQAVVYASDEAPEDNPTYSHRMLLVVPPEPAGQPTPRRSARPSPRRDGSVAAGGGSLRLAGVRRRVLRLSRMSREQRILLAAVAAIMLLFVGAIGWGGRDQGDANAGQPPDFLEWLGGLMPEPPGVDPGDLSDDCRAPSPSPERSEPLRGRQRVVVSGSCVLTVAPSETNLRSLRLVAIDAISVEAPVPHGTDTATKDVAAGEELTVSIDPDGGSITLTCAGDTCSVDVG